MKKIFSILFILFAFSSTTFAQSEQIQWRTIEEVEELQLKQARKVLIDVYTTWCGPCKLMMKNTFSNKNVIEYINKHYYAVKFDAESGKDIQFLGNTFRNPGYNPNAFRKSTHQFAQFMNVSSYPTVIYMDENLEVIAPIKGYLKPDQIELYLKLFAENIYLDVKSKEEFQKFQEGFKPTFHLSN